jgi:hypothetical protein
MLYIKPSRNQPGSDLLAPTIMSTQLDDLSQRNLTETMHFISRQACNLHKKMCSKPPNFMLKPTRFMSKPRHYISPWVNVLCSNSLVLFCQNNLCCTKKSYDQAKQAVIFLKRVYAKPSNYFQVPKPPKFTVKLVYTKTIKIVSNPPNLRCKSYQKYTLPLQKKWAKNCALYSEMLPFSINLQEMWNVEL